MELSSAKFDLACSFKPLQCLVFETKASSFTEPRFGACISITIFNFWAKTENRPDWWNPFGGGAIIQKKASFSECLSVCLSTEGGVVVPHLARGVPQPGLMWGGGW